MADEIREAFKFFDSSGDNKIAVSEVGNCLRVLGHAPTEEQVANLTKHWNEDAQVSVEEFVPIVNNIVKQKEQEKQFTPEDYIEAFSQFDREGTGLIRSTDLKYMLMHMGERLSREEVEKTLWGFESAEGKVDVAKYVHRMCDLDTEF